ncbi:MAG TPA: UGSC family (seleno)protein, partial [Ilumatobacteraceae bacterium]|nr:UGSC family (seleno)protein [Ilumatobacteraceae bacterium]
MTRYVLDPSNETKPADRPLQSRPATLDGQVIALLDIGKARGDVFLDHLDARLTALGVATKRYKKPTFTKPAPVDLRHEIATNCTMVIEALAD